MSIKVTPQEFSRDIRKRFKNLPKGIDKSIRKAAHRGRGLLVRRTPVDTGQMKNSWRVDRDDSIVNDAPHAGIIEEGARPHKVSAEGLESIARWAMRQLGVSEAEAKNVAFGLARKLAKQGQKGLFIVRDSLEDLRKFAVRQVEIDLKKQSKTRVK